jgi:hypothetical protein
MTLRLCIAALAAVFVIQPARAAVVTYDIRTFLNTPTNDRSHLPPALAGVANGDSMDVLLTVDTSTPATSSGAGWTLYPGAVLSAVATVGGTTLTLGSAGNSVEILTNYATGVGYVSGFTAQSAAAPGPNYTGTWASFNFVNEM